MSTLIDVRNLSKTYKVHQKKAGILGSVRSLISRDYKWIDAVADVSFQIKKGEIRGLLGPNGAGKSTTLKMICGILYPTSGSIRVMDFVPWSNREQYVRHIGVVFGQKSQLIWDLPPADTFALQKEMYKIPTQKFKEYLDYLVEMLNLSDIMYKPVRLLSLGERMKCELVGSILHDPEIIILDEPTIGLDIVSKETIRNFIKQLNKDKQATVILTTHDLSDVEDLCNHLTIINEGKVVFDEPMSRLGANITSRKIVEVKFSEPVGREQIAHLNADYRDPYTARIEIDMKQSNLKQEVYGILSDLPVIDININAIPIEEIIKQLYTMERSS
ncbi:ABC transporter ATP-binding protein [Paenibacillus xylaniclasticus]|uniref:ABC transporter ATP-binding protein n=1 Tax=Paenibacillus xylaniclasticus TaxID=588083 RepID=UPI001751D7E0|nr:MULTISPECIES: ATP-binding cassette domain-containing protein [Paenibacillus]GFN33207.1 ABC transporter [Paenibacillus curdlanolyticus]